ncbi:hypothetical protein LCGC14_2219070, partial [marine sediment metagenome]
ESKTAIDFTQGALIRTGRPLDLALNGKGFFVIETPAGELYTRNGTCAINPDGQLVDTQGRVIAGEDGAIAIPGTASSLDVHVSSDGAISVTGKRIGKLKLVEFEDTSLLMPVGGGCYRPTGPVELKEAAGTTVQQGYREGSNVSAVKELVRLITVSRLYQANVKSVGSHSDRLKHLLQVAMGT